MLPRVLKQAAHVAAVLAIAVLALAGCRETPSKSTPIHFNPNMDNQAYVQAQEPVRIEVEGQLVFADQRAMRPYVEGTIAATAAGRKADSHYYTGKLGPESWHAGLPSQIALSERLIRRGQQRYEIYCGNCHGLAGNGDGIIVAKGMTPPPTYHDEQRRSYGLGRIFDMITNGSEVMPALGSQIPVDDRWAIAAYVRTLQVSHNVAFSQVPAEVRDEKGWK